MFAFNPDCVRKIANWSMIKPHAKFEKATFIPNKLNEELQTLSPKIHEMLKKIEELDKSDIAKEGKMYKHFIFSDVKQGGYGAKIISSSLLAAGLRLAYDEKLIISSDQELIETAGKNFALLCSTGVYDKTINIKLKKGILNKYNQRPENVNGDLLRFIVMDSGYKEGIDLFDVKYVHILEPQVSKADEKQVIGRGTRTCGQKGLTFQPNAGWPLEVYVYDVEIPNDIAELLDAKTLFQLYVKHSNIDVRKIAFSNNLERMAIVGSVDYELNKSIHDFSVKGEEMDINKIFDGSLNASVQKGGAAEGFCAAKCGARATKAMPLSTLKFAAAFFALGYKLPKQFDTSKDLRAHFCELMKKDEEYCATLHDLNEDIKAFFSKHAEELVLSIKTRAYLTLPKRYGKYFRAFVYTFLPREGKAAVGPMSPISTNGSAEPSPSGSIKDTVDTQNATIEKATKEEEVVGHSPDSVPAIKTKHNMGFLATREHIRTNFSKYKWPKVELENMCGEVSKSGGGTVIDLNPTQSFVSSYFTPDSPIKGMLLYHSVGTGKTCTAIATATSTFEKEGYTILWVTRTTLKSDIWKNMFDQVCSASIKQMMNEGKKIPVEQAERMRLLSNSWSIRPMSYKQFSNLVERKNDFYKALVKKNGADDPLRKTLLIIDEAHKLYGGSDLSAVERPNMYKLKKAIHASYHKSGKDSVKVMLMTATPYTNDPMELVKLINLLKPKGDQIPDDFDEFADTYLNEDGVFTRKGHMKFLDDVSGYVSYLNREKDARQFSQPFLIQVKVPMSRPTTDMGTLHVIDDEIEDKKGEIAYRKNQVKEIKKEGVANVREAKGRCKGLKKEARAECLSKVDGIITDIKRNTEIDINKIMAEVDDMTMQLKESKANKKKAKDTIKNDPSQYGVLMSKCKKKPKKEDDSA